MSIIKKIYRIANQSNANVDLIHRAQSTPGKLLPNMVVLEVGLWVSGEFQDVIRLQKADTTLLNKEENHG